MYSASARPNTLVAGGVIVAMIRKANEIREKSTTMVEQPKSRPIVAGRGFERGRSRVFSETMLCLGGKCVVE